MVESVLESIEFTPTARGTGKAALINLYRT